MVKDKRIDEIQMDEDEYFVYLKSGYRLYLGTPFDFQHCFGAKNRSEIIEQMRNVAPCNCESCSKLLNEEVV